MLFVGPSVPVKKKQLLTAAQGRTPDGSFVQLQRCPKTTTPKLCIVGSCVPSCCLSCACKCERVCVCVRKRYPRRDAAACFWSNRAALFHGHRMGEQTPGNEPLHESIVNTRNRDGVQQGLDIVKNGVVEAEPGLRTGPKCIMKLRSHTFSSHFSTHSHTLSISLSLSLFLACVHFRPV